MSKLSTSRRHLFAAGAVVATTLATRAATARWWDRDDDHDHDHDHDRDDRRERHCFAAGTMIRTVDGEKPIEEIAIGEHLPVYFGGKLHVEAVERGFFVPWALHFTNEYGRELLVSPTHALLTLSKINPVSNVTLVEAACLAEVFANWRKTRGMAFYHIRLSRHDVVWANGFPCETLRRSPEPLCAPLIRYEGARREFLSRCRRALVPIVDLRRPEDVVRDRIAFAA